MGVWTRAISEGLRLVDFIERRFGLTDLEQRAARHGAGAVVYLYTQGVLTLTLLFMAVIGSPMLLLNVVRASTPSSATDVFVASFSLCTVGEGSAGIQVQAARRTQPHAPP
jgi:hypothetical protein